MLKIRLARVGKKKKPTYRFVVSESGRDLYGPSLEILGHFNPFTKVVDVDKEWLQAAVDESTGWMTSRLAS